MITHDNRLDLENFLSHIPLFSSIPSAQIQKIAGGFQHAEYEKNAIIFKQGDPSDAAYIIRSGVVEIFTEKDDVKIFLTELRRGDFFGEMALLSDLPRNATVKVSLDAAVYFLKKDDFEQLLAENKSIGLYLSRYYARRLTLNESRCTVTHPVFYTVSATGDDLGLSHFIYSMSYHISTESEKKILVVEPSLELTPVMHKLGLYPFSCPDESLFGLLPRNVYQPADFRWFCHRAGFIVLQVNKGFSEKLHDALPHLMESFKYRFDTVFFNLLNRFGTIERHLIRLSDKNLVLINNTADALPQVRERVKAIEKQSGPGFDKVRVGVSHLSGSRGMPRAELKQMLNLSEIPKIWVARSDKAYNDEIDTEKRFPVREARAVAREIAGVRVGIALGAGAARGWAHIGVLKVLEDEGIHIDMIAGTSMGALVGAIYAAKASCEHLKKYTIDLFPNKFTARRKIFDYTLPFKGLLRGKKAMQLVATAVDDADFMDLLIPTYLVGVDILKGEEVLIDTGSVARAVRSSIAIPGIFIPHNHDGRWIVDGGLLNPVPVDILEQKGADKIIAVCVEKQGSASRMNNDIGIMDVISRTISIVHGKATSRFTEKSDIVIYPDVSGFNWDDFHRGEILMQRGVEACREHLGKIKKLVNYSSASS